MKSNKEINSVTKLKERMQLILEDPDLVDFVCATVASGGSLINLARDWNVRYSDISKWMYDDKIRQFKYTAALNARNEWAKEAVLAEIRSIAFGDMRILYNAEGKLLPIKEWPQEALSLVAGLETEELKGKSSGNTMKLKLYDRLKALELLGKTMALFSDTINVKVSLSTEELVMASYRRHKEKTVNETQKVIESNKAEAGPLADIKAPETIDAVCIKPDEKIST